MVSTICSPVKRFTFLPTALQRKAMILLNFFLKLKLMGSLRMIAWLLVDVSIIPSNKAANSAYRTSAQNSCLNPTTHSHAWYQLSYSITRCCSSSSAIRAVRSSSGNKSDVPLKIDPIAADYFTQIKKPKVCCNSMVRGQSRRLISYSNQTSWNEILFSQLEHF